ncbi:hypothetical protein E4631_07805 [Hymenobacter sp. UV11]|uniref:hypothetical protein n=1 Tax=Hymenobacter sp. UV11 TaxID=1849735 RepID=UPI0010605300|nr:hypothetical protein [Hymenobacter sp. UV11]TDN36166.1 hypothetical protein A8B98_09515 [Hymenobacter sp. UV11]TFZ66866.1 hypothetical protein E4631_07805 [Hymenobacter sp. UV11]
MTTKFILLASAAAFTFASCSQDAKTTETTTTTLPAGTDTTRVTAVDTLAYRNAADELTTRVAADLHNTDAAFQSRLQQVYYTRGRALRDIDTRYTADTTGRYAAVKAVNDQTSTTVKTIVPAAEYTTYTSNAGNYYAGPYSATTRAVAKATETKPSLGARVGQGSGVKKLENSEDEGKVKYNNGAKIKRSDDGSLKIKRADGTKVKIDENGHRTVKKGLF